VDKAGEIEEKRNIAEEEANLELFHIDALGGPHPQESCCTGLGLCALWEGLHSLVLILRGIYARSMGK
jgi:hypothetical protein